MISIPSWLRTAHQVLATAQVWSVVLIVVHYHITSEQFFRVQIWPEVAILGGLALAGAVPQSLLVKAGVLPRE